MASAAQSPLHSAAPNVPSLPGSVTELQPLQFAGLRFATVTLVAILLVMAVLLLKPTVSLHPAPPGLTLDQLTIEERWAKMQSGYLKDGLDRSLQMAQLLITGTLLPVLTAVLGYLFAKRED